MEPTTEAHVEAARDAYDVAAADALVVGRMLAEAFVRATDETDEVRRLAARYAIAVRAERYAEGVLRAVLLDYRDSAQEVPA